MTDFERTPSFYNSTEQFEKYLGQTSYYTNLQESVEILAEHIAPSEIVELGTGTGDTAIKLSQSLPDTQITAVDKRETIIEEARENADDERQISFVVGDMIEYVTDGLPELVVMLYSFHHIPDPLQKKEEFLSRCYRALPEGGYLCVAETFLEQMGQTTEANRQTRDLWEQRGVEAYASTLWQALDGLDDSDIESAQEVAEFSAQHELEAGENVVERDDEYLVTRDWLEQHAVECGFEVVLSEPCNSLGEAVVLLQKPGSD